MPLDVCSFDLEDGGVPGHVAGLVCGVDSPRSVGKLPLGGKLLSEEKGVEEVLLVGHFHKREGVRNVLAARDVPEVVTVIPAERAHI